jgi:serine/threonine-protein kinase
MPTQNSTSTEAQDPLVGSVIDGRYSVVGLLGRGGLCSVYRADDKKGGNQVAVKVLPKDRAGQPEMAARFSREAAAGKRIKHENVVAITDTGKLAGGAMYLVMELLHGRSLEAELTSGGRIPPARAIELGRQVLSGLEVAHAMGIVHRDIKPDNIMIEKRDGRDLVKLVDFGIASNEKAAIKLTAMGVAFGTPEYISPEMAKGLEVDARADLYSVGVVLFHAVTGQLPFPLKAMNALLLAHVNTPAPPPRTVAPDAGISPALEAVILRALAKMPEERFASAQAMREALEALQKKPTAVSRGRVWLAAAIALVVAAAGAAWWWYGARR